jgi:3-phenylpropionate/trans-cinnamate dioxygenase ferredoxin subunit
VTAENVTDSSAETGAFARVCSLSDLSDGQPHKAVIGETAIAVVLTEGEVYAINDTCSHGQVSLAEGEVEGCLLECWLHGSQFDLRTGQPVSLPATDPVPVYPVKVEDDTVFVRI